MLRRVASLAAPGVVLLSPRSLPGHHVRVGAPLPGVVNRLVDVQHDAVLRGRLDHLAIVPHHVLSVVRVAFARQVGDVARLDGVEAERMVEREGAIQLALVVLDSPRRLVVDDQLHTLLMGVARDLREIVIGIGSREREGVAVLNPVAVPADVPALDQHAAQSVGGGEVDVAFRVRGGRAVFGPRAPGHGADVHAPPDAHVLHRFDPARALEHAGWVQVEAEHRRHEIGCAVGELDGPPGRDERRVPAHLDPVGPGREVCM